MKSHAKKIILFLSAFALMLTFFAAGAVAEESPLQIGTAEQLRAFAARVTAAANGDEALCAVLTADIDLLNKSCNMFKLRKLYLEL
jgi:CheY-like chemotaxis protein